MVKKKNQTTMKKGIAKLTVFLMFFFTGHLLSANTGDYPGIEIKPMSYGSKISVSLNGLKGDAEMRLLDADGNVLIDEKIESQPVVRKVLNLEKLANGEYSLIIATARQEIMQPIRITEKALLVDAASRKTYLVPTIKVGDNYVDVMWLNSRVADMTVSFVDSYGGKTVFRDELKNKLKVEKRYNVSNLDRGAYTVVVSTPDHTHYERLIVE